MKPQKVKYMLMAQNMKRAVYFYTKVLGFELSFESEFWTELRFEDSTVALHGGWNGGRYPTGLSIQYLSVDKIYREVIEWGARKVQEPQSSPGEPVKIAKIRDPEGNEIMLTEYTG